MLRSNRITLVPLSEFDVSEEYLGTLNNKAYMRYSRNSSFDHTLTSQSQYIADFNRSNNLLFGIKDAVSIDLVGTINCYINFTEMTLDLGFLVFTNRQGKGYASEALKVLIPYLETQFPGMTLVIGSDRKNLSMHQVAINLGFQLDSQSHQKGFSSFRFFRTLPKLNSTIMPSIPDFVLNAKRIGIAANDAGGAEQISWLIRNLPHKIVAYIDGPAKQIFENSGVHFERATQLGELMNCDLLITGSGWMSQLEVLAIKEAKIQNVPCITFLDHWVNYIERFGEDKSCHPQIIAVTNSAALQMAQDKFPDKVVWIFPDFQIESYVEEIQGIKNFPTSVLILLEPTSNLNLDFPVNDANIEYLIESAISLKRARGLKSIVIRPHPSQKFDLSIAKILEKYDEEIEISKSAMLLEDLKNSEVVLGFNSYGLYISSQCGITSFSYYAGKLGHWTNYFPQLLALGSSGT